MHKHALNKRSLFGRSGDAGAKSNLIWCVSTDDRRGLLSRPERRLFAPVGITARLRSVIGWRAIIVAAPSTSALNCLDSGPRSLAVQAEPLVPFMVREFGVPQFRAQRCL